MTPARISIVPSALDPTTTDSTLADILEGIGNGRWQSQVKAVRTAYASGGKPAADGPKRLLPGALFSGTFTRRASDALTNHSGLICVDLDHLGPQLEGIRDLVASDEHTLAAFISPTGTGLKVIFRCDPARPHIESYRAAERYVLERFGLQIDTACKDVSRICFVSHDPDIMVAESAVPLPYPPPQQEFKAPAERMPAARLLAGTTPGDDYDQRGDVPSLLLSHGWTRVGRHGWRRPGKESGISATWDHVPGRLYVFSSSTAFTPNHVYRGWHVYAMLEHGGDFSRAARALGELGFGEQRNGHHQPITTPEPVYQDAQCDITVDDDDAPKPPVAEPESRLKPERLAELRTLLSARKFDGAKRLPKPRVIYSIAGTVVSTPGNLTSIYSQAKTGKSSLIGAMMAAAMTTPTAGHDTLSVEGPNYSSHAILHFDTEQSPYDWQQVMLTSLRRVDAQDVPTWLNSYNLTGSDATSCRQVIEVAMADAKAAHGGIHSVIIDGIADLVTDPNDSEACFPLITELHALAIRYDTAIILVLHMNPGSQNEKGRGHLGSQLERKSESNLTLTKDGEATVISSTRQRGRPIPKDDKAPSFRWSDERQMHISCGAVPKEPTGKRGRPEVYPFSIYSPLFPETMAQAMTLTPLAKRLSVNRPISAKQLGNVLERWEKEGAVISADAPHGRVYYKRFQSVTSTAGRT